jgi:hypothetical protein
VGPFLVVLRYPGFGEIPNLGNRIEQIGIEHFFSIGSVEALDKGVLIRLTRLDVPQLDLSPFTPLGRRWR